MPTLILLDNTVLTNLALVHRMDLVFQLWPEQVCTTPEVLVEYENAVKAGVVLEHAWKALPTVELTDEEATAAAAYSSRLGKGERSCLSVAHARGGLFISDDADARLQAHKLGIPVSGTLGILVLAVRRKVLILDDANVLLEAMVAAGYRSPVNKVDGLL